MMPLGAPSISKYGSLVRSDAQIATAIERGGRIRIGPLVGKDGARWLYNPCRLGDPHRLRAGGRIRKGPTSGQGGYITPLGAFGARWLLGPIPLTTNCRPEAPGGGGGGGSWRPRTCGVVPSHTPPTFPPLPFPPTEGGTSLPPPLGRCRHTPGQSDDAGRLLPCALPRESVSGNFSRRHVLGALTTTTTTTTSPPYPPPTSKVGGGAASCDICVCIKNGTNPLSA